MQKLKQKSRKLFSRFRSHSKERATLAQSTPRISADAPPTKGAGLIGGAAALPRESSPAAKLSGTDTPPVEGTGPRSASGAATPLPRGCSSSTKLVADAPPEEGAGPTDDADVIEDSETSDGSVSLGDVAKIVAGVAGTVSEFSDAFPPLKTVAIGLKLIFERVETAQDNKKQARDLGDRIGQILQMLETSPNDPDFKNGYEKLSKNLTRIAEKLCPIQGLKGKQTLKDGCLRFLKATGNADIVQECITTVDHVLSDYQLSMVRQIHNIVCRQMNAEEKRALFLLKYSKDASLVAEDRQQCYKGTRKELLMSLRIWAQSGGGDQFFWLHGPAGSGKTTITQTFAYWLHSKARLGASFFCSSKSAERSNLAMIFPTIAFQLATSTNVASPEFRAALLRALDTNPDGTSLSLRNQLHDLIIHPAQTSSMKTIIVIDALDECVDTSTTSTLLSLLAEAADQLQTLKFFIASRPEFNIRAGFHCQELSLHSHQQSLNDVPSEHVTHDIRLFLKSGLERMVKGRSHLGLPEDWPDLYLLDRLTREAGGLFIFASTLLKYIDNAHHDPRDRLKDILSNTNSFENEGTAGIDSLYMNILKQAISKGNEKSLERLRQVLSFLVTAYQPLSPTAVSTLLHLERTTDIFTSLEFLHSVIAVPNDLNKPINFYHKSFPDFLTDANRCTDTRFFVDRDEHHFLASGACLLHLQGCLKKNICSVPRYTLHNTINHEHIFRHCINESLAYCCRYWVTHLVASAPSNNRLLQIREPLLEFLKTQQLQWFEAFTLVGHDFLHPAYETLGKLQSWLESVQHKEEALQWVIWGRRFLYDATDLISDSMIYHPSLPFCLRTSLFRHQYERRLESEGNDVMRHGCQHLSANARAGHRSEVRTAGLAIAKTSLHTKNS